MGTKRAGKRQCLLFRFACVVALLLLEAGCAHFPPALETQHRLDESEKWLAIGDYESALKAGEAALKKAPYIVRDRALYLLALIYAHPENPSWDIHRSGEYLQRLVRDFPKSSYREEAGVWIRIFHEMGRRAQKIGKTEATVATLEQTVAALKKNLRDKDKEIEQLQSSISQIQGRLDDLKGRVERLKEIDLGIEEKKRKALPQ